MEVSSINTQCTAIIFIRLLLSTTNFSEAKLCSTFLSPIVWKIFKDCSPITRKYSKTFSPANLSPLQIINKPKIFKDFFACKFVLAANHQQPENIQRLFRLQNCLSRKSSTIFRKYSKTFWAINSSNQQQQSTKAINSSNQQQQSATAINSSNQQQQSTAATKSSDQQQQSTAATRSSNQQQQPKAATSSSNQQQQPKAAFDNNNQLQQQPAFDLPASSPQSTTTYVRYNYGS